LTHNVNCENVKKQNNVKIFTLVGHSHQFLSMRSTKWVRTKNEIWHTIMVTNVIWSCGTNFDISSNKWSQM